MNTAPSEAGAAAGPQTLMSAMFAGLVMQSTNMALIFLGQTPNPQTGQTAQDLDNARYFIDQLAMLEAKTKGNLNKQEESLLKQSLTNLRMAFVEAVEHPMAAPKAGPEAAAQETPPTAPATDEQETPVVEPVLPGERPGAAGDTEPRKKFSKKY
jgi:hypothetical protein